MERKTNGELNEEQQKDLDDLIASNADIFAKSIADVPGTQLHYHRINTGDAAPKRQRGYMHSRIAKKKIEHKIKENLENEIMEPLNVGCTVCVCQKERGGDAHVHWL